MSPGLVDWPKSPMIFFTNLGRAKIIKYKYDDGSVSVSELFFDKRLVVRDITVTQCKE